jgi:hypothetical protein
MKTASIEKCIYNRNILMFTLALKMRKAAIKTAVCIL